MKPLKVKPVKRFSIYLEIICVQQVTALPDLSAVRLSKTAPSIESYTAHLALVFV